MGRTEISVSTLHNRNFCTPHYRNFCVKQMKQALVTPVQSQTVISIRRPHLFSNYFKGLSSNDLLKNFTTVILRQLSLQPFPGLNFWPLPLLTLSKFCPQIIMSLGEKQEKYIII
jgi:hypothetical protein